MKDIINEWLGSEMLESITYTVMQSLWQGVVIGVITYILLKYKAKDNSQHRYNISLAGIATLFTTSIITFLIHYINFDQLGSTQDLGIIQLLELSDIIELDGESSSFWIAYMWMIGVAFYMLKFTIDIGVVQFIRITSTENGNTEKYQELITNVRDRLSYNRSIDIKVSKWIYAPVTIGMIKPIILFPIGMLNQLTVTEVESIMSHEIAHIIRKDYFVNICQTIMEIILFYHPMVWWLSKVSREEREYCCDDIALYNKTTAIDYAKTLVKVQELSIQQKSGLALSFADQSMKNRIKRIMNLPKSNNKMKERLIATVAVMSLLLFFSKDMIANATEKMFAHVEVINSDIRPEIEVDMNLAKIDTLPEVRSNTSYTITKSDDDGSMTIQKKDGKITKLEIDGRTIAKENYDEYQEEIDEFTDNGLAFRSSDGFRIAGDHLELFLDKNGGTHWINADSIIIPNIDVEHFEEFGESMEHFGEMMGEWGENFGNRFEFLGDSMRDFTLIMPDELMDPEAMERLREIMEGIDLNGLQELQGLENLKLLEGLEGLEMLEGLESLEQLEGIEELRDLGVFPRYFDMDGNRLPNRFDGNRTVEDKIGYELRKDRLIALGEISEIELSGKHMKVNGDKQPKNIWIKYKEIFEEESGITLSKDSKLKFKVEGKKTIKKSKSF